jgi:pyridoxine 5'-phosphate synthase PdxJ
MVPVHRVMPHALAAVLRQAPLSPAKVAFAWRMAVGPALDQATTVHLREDVLHVEARDAAWRREIERSRTLIQTRLAALLGEAAVRRVQVAGTTRPDRVPRPG